MNEMKKTTLLAIVLVCVLWLPFSCALVGDETIQLRRSLLDFEQFGFARNGVISLKVTTFPVQENVSLYICTDKEFDLLNSYLDPEESTFCNNPTSYCEYSGDHRLEVNDYRVTTKNRYRIIFVVKCVYAILCIVLINLRFCVIAMWSQRAC